MKTSIILFSILFLAIDVFACKSPIATSTIYYSPSALKVCGKWYYGKVRDKKEPWTFKATEKVCPKFEAAVKLEGSGRYNPEEVYTYAHEVMNFSGEGKTQKCPTATGRSGKCLLTYVSVAADPRYHHMGDLISMPGLKGKKLTLPDGTTFTHPGYLRVDDVGSAIKGANRFDFYTGNMDEPDKKNTFGLNGPDDARMSEINECPTRKTFSVVTSSSEKAKAKKAIEDSFRNVSFNSILGIKAAAVNSGPYPAPVNRINKGVGHGN